MTSIAVSATPANEKAVVESVSGNENLKEGVNQIKIVVKAENGVTATYTIKVTKQSGGAADTKPEGGEDTPEGGTDGTELPGESSGRTRRVPLRSTVFPTRFPGILRRRIYRQILRKIQSFIMEMNIKA